MRFRPIMMTTMAALMGTLPIAIGFGAGGEARQPLGLAVVGGLMLSQLLTLYITPVIYVYLDTLGTRVSQWKFIKRGAPAGHTGADRPGQPGTSRIGAMLPAGKPASFLRPGNRWL